MTLQLFALTAAAFLQAPVCGQAPAPAPPFVLKQLGPGRSEEHTSELQSHRDLPPFPPRRSSDLLQLFALTAAAFLQAPVSGQAPAPAAPFVLKQLGPG